MYTLLHLAASHGFGDVVEILLQHGANINELTNSNETLLHCSVRSRSKRCVEICLQHGADKTIKNKLGYTPLDFAKALKYPEIAKIIEEFQDIPDVKQPDE